MFGLDPFKLLALFAIYGLLIVVVGALLFEVLELLRRKDG